MPILDDLQKIIEAEVKTPIPANETNVGDAPVESELTIKITFGDLRDDVQANVKELLMKNMKATDEISKNNLIRTLNTNPIFDGTVEAFKNLIGIKNV